MSDAADVRGVERALAAGAAGVRAVAARLDAATPAEGRLRADGDALTPGRLECVADAAVADAGGADPGTRVETRDGTLRPGAPVVVALEPTVEGVPGPWSRTFVVDGAGGWERRAAVAVEMAHDAVVRAAEPGVPARRVVDEAVAELGAYGLGTAEVPVAWSVGEGPAFPSETPLAAGETFALAPAAVDPGGDRGRVRIGTCYVVTESGVRALGDLPTSLSPGAY
ncbi:M24 family metallopeptidase [Haloplanus halophilus]|uniref:M24 family metallopeptidase n=1 Tax=Haloplanus halophilus TaxID=2949993 RepID=UPI00203DD730|nr:M24 family metallopeptidase [Haloplanus sp. GDY1]